MSTVKPLMLASIVVSVFILGSTKGSVSCYYTMRIVCIQYLYWRPQKLAMTKETLISLTLMARLHLFNGFTVNDAY